MLKKIVTGFLVLATSTLFGMSLNQLNTASKAQLMEINGIGEKKGGCNHQRDEEKGNSNRLRIFKGSMV